MNLGEKLLNLRKSKQLSQEEAADKLDVTRQTISKWETNQSTPDFDKIIPICELYEITTDELLKGTIDIKKNLSLKNEDSIEDQSLNDGQIIKKKKALGIGFGVLLYFVSVVWIMISIPVMALDPIVSSAIFILICGMATFSIVYTCIIYKNGKIEIESPEDRLRKQIAGILAIIFVIIYLVISFVTMEWHLTWILWIIYALVCEILKLIFMLRGTKNEK